MTVLLLVLLGVCSPLPSAALQGSGAVVQLAGQVVQLKQQLDAVAQENQEVRQEEGRLLTVNQRLQDQVDRLTQQSQGLRDEVNRLSQENAFLLAQARCQLQSSVIGSAAVISPSLSPPSHSAYAASPPFSTHVEDCWQMMAQGSTRTDIYLIQPPGKAQPVHVRCEHSSEGGWTVLLRRDAEQCQHNMLRFLNTWEQYVHGFGYPLTEYWLGLETQHLLTRGCTQRLRLELQASTGERRSATWEHFIVGDEASQYMATLSDYDNSSSSLGDVLSWGDRFTISGQPFTTEGKCANVWGGGWWYNDCRMLLLPTSSMPTDTLSVHHWNPGNDSSVQGITAITIKMQPSDPATCHPYL